LKKAFAISIPLSIYRYQPYTKYYLIYHLFDSSLLTNLSLAAEATKESNSAHQAAYKPFTPD